MNASEPILTRYLQIPPESETENTLRLLIRMGLLVAGADEGSLMVLDEPRNELVFAMTIGPAASEAALRGQRVPLDRGISGLAAATLEVQIGAPIFKDVHQSQPAGAPGDAPEVVMAAPMLAGEQLVGVITAVSFDAAKRFSTHDGRLFGGFAAIAGAVVAQAQRIATLASTSADLMPSEADETRQRVADSVARIIRRRPDAAADIADLLASLERMLSI